MSHRYTHITILHFSERCTHERSGLVNSLFTTPQSLWELTLLEIKKRNVQPEQLPLPPHMKEELITYYLNKEIHRAILFQRYVMMAPFIREFSKQVRKAYNKLLVEYYADAILFQDRDNWPLPDTWANSMLLCLSKSLHRRDFFARQDILAKYPRDVQFVLTYILDVIDQPFKRRFPAKHDNTLSHPPHGAM